MLKFSQSSKYYNPAGWSEYAFGHSRASIIADINHDGYTDIVTFPSVLKEATGYKPIVWLNDHGRFTPRTDYIIDGKTPQFIRDSIEGDFNGDGYTDWILVDQGWELNNRDPKYFFGSELILLTGGEDGLTWNDTSDWLKSGGGNAFNHVGAAGDFDNDGDLDFAVAAFRDGLRIYSNNGQGEFSIMPVEHKFKGSLYGGSFDPSGVTFINIGGVQKVVAGEYRFWDANDSTESPKVLGLKNGVWIEEQTIEKPEANGIGRNYGATDMYNKDINGDGREDLTIIWETDNRGGINDGLSDMSGIPQINRYEASLGLSDNIATTYLQTADGKLELQGAYVLKGFASCARINWDDVNHDGSLDFWYDSLYINPNEVGDTIFINNGAGNFSTLGKVPFEQELPDWYRSTTMILDANNDGNLDLVTLRSIHASNNWGDLGEEMSVYLNDPPMEYRTVESVMPAKDIAYMNCTSDPIYHFEDGTTWQDTSYFDPYFF